VAHGRNLISFSLFAYDFRRNWARIKYTTDASASKIPFTANSRTVACERIQTIATMARAGAIFMPGQLNGCASERISRVTKSENPAQHRMYINRTATLDR